MLYPIELLRHWVVAAGHGATDGVHVNGQPLICHVVRGLFKCRQAPCDAAGTFTVQFALPRKSHHCRLQPEAWGKPLQMLVFKGLHSG